MLPGPGGASDENQPETVPWGEWKLLPETGILCIDTGCGKGGSLTGMIVDGGQFRLEKVFETG